MRKLFIVLPIAGVAIGCGMGDVPTETVPVSKAPQNTAPASAETQSTGDALQNNPNLPPAAKEALLGKTGR